MPVSNEIDPGAKFDSQVASGIRLINADTEILKVEREIALDLNRDRAILFFSASDIFAKFNPTDDSNTARAICCLKVLICIEN
jgi:hypothetical protein